jgi:putative solute:sodium symporter small subunit
MTVTEGERRRWRLTQRLTLGVLAVWFATTFGVAYFARELSAPLFGFPFSFWVACQGAPLVYVLLVVLYARRVGRLERAAGPPAG